MFWCPDVSFGLWDRAHADETLKWRHNERDAFSNHRRLDCLLNCLVRQENIKAPASLAFGGEFTCDRWIPTQRASNAENVPFWWRYHDLRGPSHWLDCDGLIFGVGHQRGGPGGGLCTSYYLEQMWSNFHCGLNCRNIVIVPFFGYLMLVNFISKCKDFVDCIS